MSSPAKRQKYTHDQTFEAATFIDEGAYSSVLAAECRWSSQHYSNETVQTLFATSATTPEAPEPTCFGTICFALENADKLAGLTGPIEVEIIENRILCSGSGYQLGTLASRDVDLIALLDCEGVLTEVLLIPASFEPSAQARLQTQIAVTIYRDQWLEDEWIDLFDEHMIYLQDPMHTRLDLPYWNPQRFHNDPDARTSAFWSIGQSAQIAHRRQDGIKISPVDFLADFTSEHVLHETEGSNFLKTPLRSHQKQALTFMTARERGWKLNQIGCDIWSSKAPDEHECFYNNVDEKEYYHPPPQFRGGLIADGMGSGKTLSMISLIVHEKDTRQSEYEKVDSRATLVVMPPHLLRTWDSELSRHVADGHLSWRSHHGLAKIRDESEISFTDVILIPYPTLASEWRRKTSSLIFHHRWHRVILDEAHSIKDHTTTTAKAAFALKSDRRWVVTGTPIQNRLSELASLFQFLQAYPYCERKAFDECITRVWAGGKAEEAVERLKRLLNFTMLRRSQKSLDLPEKTDLKVVLDFDDEERVLYDAAREKTMRSIDDLINSVQSSESYLNALQKINALRLICNLGRPSVEKHKTPAFQSLEATSWNRLTAQQTLASLSDAGIQLFCASCAVAIDTLSDDLLGGDIWVRASQCLQVWCQSCCAGFVEDEPQGCSCSAPGCSSAMVSLNLFPTTPLNMPSPMADGKFPTKIRQLTDDLARYSPYEKCIVFSSWKSTLDLARSSLEEQGISCVQIDGRVKPRQREQIFHDFTHQEGVRVLLLSLACGSSGLTLTAASRVYLMEPQWNPATEEQAMARVYRIGQTRNVTTTRYIINDSIEKHVLAIQDWKKDLITLLLSCPSSASTKKLTKQRLMELKELL